MRAVRQALFPLALMLAASGAPAGHARPAAEPAFVYRLSQTWSKHAWQPQAGRFGRAVDIAAAADGTAYVLDGRQSAVHVMDPSGQALRLFTVPRRTTDSEEWTPLRLDAAPDGTIFVLLEGPFAGLADAQYRYRVDHLSPEGRELGGFEVPLDPRALSVYRDIAIGPAGQVYLSRMDVEDPFFDWAGEDPTPEPPPGTPPPGVDAFAGGARVAILPTSCQPDHLDAGEDGRVYVVNRCPAAVGQEPEPEPGDPEPSWGRARPAGPDQLIMPAEEGVAVFAPDGAYERFHPFQNPEDVATGVAGTFVSRNVEIFALGEDDPLYAGPASSINAAYLGRLVHNLAAPATGTLLASMNHCAFQGLLRFDHPSDRPATPLLFGALDQPELEGPINPWRVAAGSTQLAVLQARFSIYGRRPDPYYVEEPYAAERQTVQRWRLAAGASLRPQGELLSQMGYCGAGAARQARDVGMDGEALYVLDPLKLESRPDDQLPRWAFWPMGLDLEPDDRPYLAAVAATAGRVAALDIGRGRVLMLDTDGRLTGDWPWGASAGAPVDMAMAGGRVYLADAVRNRILVRGLEGEDLGEWPTADSPRRVALGPEGDLFLLSGGGWGLRYSPDGTLRALWAMPDRDARPHDLSVDAAGRVLVAYTRTEAMDAGDEPIGSVMREIVDAGVWVFEPSPLPAPPAGEPGACRAAPDKSAQPARIPLGQTVDVSLTVTGDCPPSPPATQLALVVDSSRSMGFDGSLDNARALLLEILPGLDAATMDLAVISFGTAAKLDQPLTRDMGAVRTSLLRLSPAGDTQLAAGLDLARQELSGPRSRPGTRKVALIVSDGAVKDQPEALAAQLLAERVALFALLFTNRTFEWDQMDRFGRLMGAPGHLVVDPGAGDVTRILDAAAARSEPSGLFQSITVEDLIPANMAYVPGSALPPAAYDPARHALTWPLGEQGAAKPLHLTYKLRPRACGLWPTNISAAADYVDALDHAGKLVFPVPEVDVTCQPAKARIYLPLTVESRCLRRARAADIVLVVDSSSSMADPAGGASAGTKLDAAREAVAAFLAQLSLGADRAAVVSFDGEARVLAGLGDDPAVLASALARLESRAGTRIDLGLRQAHDVLRSEGRAGALPVVILLTDGLQNQEQAPNAAVESAAAALRADGAGIHAIGLGPSLDLPLLVAVAGGEGRVHLSPDAAALKAIYGEVAAALACEGE